MTTSTLTNARRVLWATIVVLTMLYCIDMNNTPSYGAAPKTYNPEGVVASQTWQVGSDFEDCWESPEDAWGRTADSAVVKYVGTVDVQTVTADEAWELATNSDVYVLAWCDAKPNKKPNPTTAL